MRSTPPLERHPIDIVPITIIDPGNPGDGTCRAHHAVGLRAPAPGRSGRVKSETDRVNLRRARARSAFRNGPHAADHLCRTNTDLRTERPDRNQGPQSTGGQRIFDQGLHDPCGRRKKPAVQNGAPPKRPGADHLLEKNSAAAREAGRPGHRQRNEIGRRLDADADAAGTLDDVENDRTIAGPEVDEHIIRTDPARTDDQFGHIETRPPPGREADRRRAEAVAARPPRDEKAGTVLHARNTKSC